MKRQPLTDADVAIFTADAKSFGDWLTAMLSITLERCGAKSRPYRQTLRLAKLLVEWRAAIANISDGGLPRPAAERHRPPDG